MNKKIVSLSFFLYGFFLLGAVSASAQGIPPLAPSDVTASAPTTQSTGTSVPATVSWTDNSNNESGFSILPYYEGVATPISGIFANAPANATSYTFATSTGFALLPATTTPIYFVVTASNSYGFARSASSTATAFVSAPARPTNFLARYRLDGTTGIGVNISWGDMSNESGYTITKVKLQSGVVLQTSFISLPQNTVSYTDSDVVSGYTYTYQMTVYNFYGVSSPTLLRTVIIP